MKIVVCVKQVLVLGDEVEFTEDGTDVDPDLLDRALNEWDTYATEEALRIREQVGAGEVVVVTAGADEADEALRRCLAMGADRAIRVETSGPLIGSALDPISAARALAEAIRPENPDLVLTGVQSGDSVQAATGTALAEFLGMARVAVVTNVEYDPGARQAVVRRELEGGLVDVTEVDLPAVLTIQTGINEPRYASLRAIKQAAQKELAVVPAGAAAGSDGAAAEPAYRVRRMFVPPKGEGAVLLEGAPTQIAQRIAEIVKERLS